MKLRTKALFAGALASMFALATAIAVAQDHPAPGGNPGTAGSAPGLGGLHRGRLNRPGLPGNRPLHAPPPNAGARDHLDDGAQSGEAREGAGAGHEGGAAAHGEHGEGEAHELKSINWTDIWDKERPAVLSLVINAGILFGIYYWLGKKPIAEALKQRRVTIGKDIEDAQKMLAEAKERAKKYQADLKNADTDAETAKTALVTSGKGEVERMLREADERAERMKRDATRLLEQEQKQVEQDLRMETIDLAVREATQLLTKNAGPEDHMRLANDLLEDLAKRPGATRTSVRPTGGAS